MGISYFFRTIYDVGLVRIFGRLKHEFKKYSYKYLTSRQLLKISDAGFKTPYYKKNLKNLCLQNSFFYESTKIPHQIRFNFLNEQKVLKIPIDWNSKKHTQLWRFNLHYFDWAREWLEIKYREAH